LLQSVLVILNLLLGLGWLLGLAKVALEVPECPACLQRMAPREVELLPQVLSLLDRKGLNLNLL